VADERARPFVQLMHHPLVHEVCFRIYGPRAPVKLFTAEVSDPPAEQVQWRQDAGLLADYDRDEVVTLVVCLGGAGGHKATVEVVPGSHRLGLLEESGDGVSTEAVHREDLEHRAVPVTIDVGSAVLVHKWLVHRPGRALGRPGSRTVTFVFVDGRARSVISGSPQLPHGAGRASEDAVSG
jgi:hypothetical protein